MQFCDALFAQQPAASFDKPWYKCFAHGLAFIGCIIPHARHFCCLPPPVKGTAAYSVASRFAATPGTSHELLSDTDSVSYDAILELLLRRLLVTLSDAELLYYLQLIQRLHELKERTDAKAWWFRYYR